MKRRSFIHIGITGAATGIVASNTLLANSSSFDVNGNKIAGAIYYTKNSPGRWSGKAGSHAPILEKTETGIQVTTGHPMIPDEHWIIKHIIFDSNFNFIAEHMFNPNFEKVAVSSFLLSGNLNKIYALSVCNLHDTWLSMLEF